MAKSALASRLDKLEALLASRLRKPPTLFLLKIATLADLPLAEKRYHAMIEAGELLPTDRAFISADGGGMACIGPEPRTAGCSMDFVEVRVTEWKPPLALPKPPLRLTYQEPEPEPQADSPKPPTPPAPPPSREEPRPVRFSGPLYYPKTGIV